MQGHIRNSIQARLFSKVSSLLCSGAFWRQHRDCSSTERQQNRSALVIQGSPAGILATRLPPAGHPHLLASWQRACCLPPAARLAWRPPHLLASWQCVGTTTVIRILRHWLPLWPAARRSGRLRGWKCPCCPCTSWRRAAAGGVPQWRARPGQPHSSLPSSAPSIVAFHCQPPGLRPFPRCQTLPAATRACQAVHARVRTTGVMMASLACCLSREGATRECLESQGDASRERCQAGRAQTRCESAMGRCSMERCGARAARGPAGRPHVLCPDR